MSCSPKFWIPLGLLAVSLAGPAGLAAAEDAPAAEAAVDGPPATSPENKSPFAETACASDFEQKCAHTRGWRLGFDCLRFHYKTDVLSQECADYTDEINAQKREQMLARQRAWQEACAPDVAKHCSEYTRQTAIKGCLYKVRDQVAEDCDAKLPYRPGYQGPGFAGWRDGSESEDFEEERARRLRPRATQRLENEKKLEEERDRKRAEVRARLGIDKTGSESEGSNADGATDSPSPSEQ